MVSISPMRNSRVPKDWRRRFISAKQFLDGGPACLVLGDNIFFGHGLPEQLRTAAKRTSGATIFGYYVKDPERYGVMEFDAKGQVVSLEEKPAHPKSDYAVVGLYFYDNQITDIAASIQPSPRGELEITDVNKVYLEQGSLHADLFGRGIAWLDTGTHESLLQASNFVEAIEQRQGLKVACLEEIAYQCGWITADQVMEQVVRLGKTDYAKYLVRLIAEKHLPRTSDECAQQIRWSEISRTMQLLRPVLH